MNNLLRRAGRLMVGPVLGFSVFWGASEFVHRGPPVTVEQESIVTVPGAPPGVIGVLVERTRHQACPATYTRFVTRTMTLGGKTLDVFLPIDTNGSVTPVPGKSEFVMGLKIPDGLRGPWKAQSAAVDRCHIWDWIWGSKPRLSPAVPLVGLPEDATDG